ncbi:arylsulfatase [Pseudoxanthomonas sangjuensis]|uniref:arylsulfatase n=1 Tax=Pseudoxanthomonas sangjuensis TaxID=1503750 RepID=UPI001391544A|nr:arylsulfatase [Pseudoxanthomonas sangjuensis]KAF1708739.1 arylsulfatase [Pseudoxanthomonas sangjuensis]
MKKTPISLAMLALGSAAGTASAQATLPFPPEPSASQAGRTLAESKHQWRPQVSRLPADAPNIVVIMLDDAGFAQADTVGGPIHTPTLTRIADSGIRYNAFHTTAISSATRAALLTGRNHHRVGSGTITELASDFDGYTGTIPKSSATVAEVLKDYGYSTAAFGKWHNTPANETGATGPFDHWPTSYGFEHFYGFLGGETSQYEPRLFRDHTPVEPPRDAGYHLTEDLATQAVDWLRRQHSEAPGKPFFLYWTPGAVHGPHQVFRSWTEKYKGRFDRGWDVYREETFKRQKALGWIPKDAKLTPRPDSLPAWDSLSAEERKFQARLMEVYAGFLEHTDTQAGRIVDELERLGLRENTLIFYVFSDNGASAEGQSGTINELLTQNGIPVSTAQQMAVLERDYGGLDALGTPLLESMYHGAWAWAGMTPFQGTKLVAGYFGGTRAPLAVSWPRAIKPDAKVRTQFHHVNDIVPTIYDVVGIVPPEAVDGIAQDPLDGVSMRYSFGNARAAGTKPAQYFEVFGSRGIYADGWMASVFGPRVPWKPGSFEALRTWNPDEDVWTLYRLDGDYSQAVDLAAAQPQKLAEMQALFDREARANKVYPIGAGFVPFLYPGQRIGSGLKEWHFSALTQRLPEFAAPNLRARNSVVAVDLDVPAQASGVVYALGGRSGGVALYFDGGYAFYEYNGMVVATTKLRSPQPLPAGRHRIEVETAMTAAKLAAPAQLTLRIDGIEVATATTPFTAPLAFTATETFDVGADLGSSVSLTYLERAPFAFTGSVHDVHVRYAP